MKLRIFLFPFNYISFYFMYFSNSFIGYISHWILGILLCWFLQHYVICVFIPIVVNEILLQYYKECHFITFQSAYFQMESLWFLLSQSSLDDLSSFTLFFLFFMTHLGYFCWSIFRFTRIFFLFSLSCVQFSNKPMRKEWFISDMVFPSDISIWLLI